MRIVICDDSLCDRKNLTEKLQCYLEKISIPYEVVHYETGEALCKVMERENTAGIIFLGMYPKTHKGTELAEELRDMNYTGEIVILTEIKSLVWEECARTAVTYLYKNCEQEQFFGCMDRLLQDKCKLSYIIWKRRESIRIPYADIVFVESNNSKCILHDADGAEYTIYKHLGEIEMELHDKRFLRCHQSYLVNMDYVKCAKKWFELVTGDIVSIRQRDIKKIKQIYRSYIECNRNRSFSGVCRAAEEDAASSVTRSKGSLHAEEEN